MDKLNCVIAENEFGLYCIPKEMAPLEIVSKTVLSGGVYERETIETILANRGDGIVIHAGAYFGDFLPAISGKNNRVYAFEPNKESCRCAHVTLLLNYADGDHDTLLFNSGLGSKAETQQLLARYDEEKNQGGVSKIVTSHIDGIEPYRLDTINVTTIDEVLPASEHNKVTVIHLDIEGFETEALKGARSVLKKSKPLLILEIGNDDILENDIFSNFLFEELGYVEENRMHGNIVFR